MVLLAAGSPLKIVSICSRMAPNMAFISDYPTAAKDANRCQVLMVGILG